MPVIDKLASSLNRRDEKPNQELAKKIADKNDKASVKELISLLDHKSKDIQFDCIKVLYEIAELQPGLVKEYTKDFISLLKNKNNRMIWGAMHALDVITGEEPKLIHSNIVKIMDAAEKGSVITKDHAVGILLKLCRLKQYEADSFTLFIELLQSCPTNQLPLYAENAISIIHEKNRKIFIETLHARLEEIEKETKRKRVEKVIKKCS